MFKNRSFQLKLIDDRKTPTEIEAKSADISEVATVVAASAMVIIITYVISDTFRQVTILTAAKKIN